MQFDLAVPTEDGHFVSEKHARIAEIIQDFNPYLHLVWIPPENRKGDEDIPPFAIMDTTPGKEPYIVFTIKEHELDERVLARLFRGDLANNDVFANLEAEERAAEVLRLKEKMEKAEERKDFISSVVGSHKHSFRHNGRIIPK
jgi:hypothetical protein